MSLVISAFYTKNKVLVKHSHNLYFFQNRIVVFTLLNEINIVMSNILNSPFALLLCLPPFPPKEKNLHNYVFFISSGCFSPGRLMFSKHYMKLHKR